MKKATREQTKQHNMRLVLRTIYHSTDISRADIARATRLTRPTVSAIVAELLEQHFVVETGQGPSAGGKPPTLLNIAAQAHALICVDIGSTTFRGAVVNLRGEVLERISFPATTATATAALERVYALIDALVALATAPILGIAVGTPGVVDPREGRILRAVNLEWADLPLKALLEARYARPVYVANDSHMATLAEYTFGGARERTNLILIKVGQGIGAGIVLGGQIFSGDGFGAGEIGHLVVAENGERCTCGNVGCLETTTSTRAILARARRAAHAEPTSRLAAAAEIEWETIVAALEAGDATAEGLVAEAGRRLGVAVASLIASYNIHHVVIAGRITRFGAPLMAAARAEIGQRVLPALASQTELHYTMLGDDLVILGCSAMILKHELGII